MPNIAEISQRFAELIKDEEFSQPEAYALYTTIYQTIRRRTLFADTKVVKSKKERKQRDI